MTEIIVKIPWVILFIHMLLWCHLESIYMNSSTLYCDDGERIRTSDYCDNIIDCEDKSDESDCENNIIVFYNTSSSKQTPRNSTLKMIILESQWNLENNIGKSLNSTDRIISVTMHNSRIYYVIDSTFHNGTRSTTLWSIFPSIGYTRKYLSFNGQVHLGRITSDWNTGNIYILILDESTGFSWIKVCQIYILKFEFCSFLNKNILMIRPVDVAISPEDLALFWIEKKNNSSFSIVKARPDGSLASEIMRNLFSPRSLFPDVIKKQLYWLEGNHIYAIKFDGTKRKLITELTEYVPLIVAFDDALYWIYSEQKAIFTCNRTNCLQSARHNLSDSYPVSVLYITSVSPVFLEHDVINPCKESGCSDICLPISMTDYTCTCNATAESQTNKASVNEYLCEDTTILIATGKERSSLNVLLKGFLSEILVRSLNYITEKTISAWSYDSINGNLILAYADEQNIYSISLKNKTATLTLSDSNYGTISSLQFDDFGNNVYWISPTKYSIKVINLNTLRTKIVYQGKPTNIPLSMTLAPNKGFMFLAFIENNRFIKIERRRMDGKGSDITIIHKEDIKNVNNTSITLHYQRHTDILFAIFEGFDKIAYFTDPTNFKNFNYKIQYISMGKQLFARSLTSLGNKIFWIQITEELQLQICGYKFEESIECEDFSCNNDMQIIGINGATEKQSPCHKNNGECDHLCLASLNKNFTCVCADNTQLIHSSKCIDLSVLGNSFSNMIHWLIFALVFGVICGCIAYFYRIRIYGQQLLSQRFLSRVSINHFTLVNNEVS